jgi:hypothetical protein
VSTLTSLPMFDRPSAGHRVVVVNRGDRHTWRANGESDTVDAEVAADHPFPAADLSD